jgi:hypothetical protein
LTPDAYALLARESAGVPRRLNALVSRVLLLGAIDKLDIIDSRVIEAVIADAGADARPAVRETEPEISAPTYEEPVAVSEPEPDRRDHIAPPETVHVDMTDLQAIRTEVNAYSAALSGKAAEPVADTELAAQLRAFEQRLTAVEQRAEEQDEVLRRVLAKLIEWAERDDRNGPFAHRAA